MSVRFAMKGGRVLTALRWLSNGDVVTSRDRLMSQWHDSGGCSTTHQFHFLLRLLRFAGLKTR